MNVELLSSAAQPTGQASAPLTPAAAGPHPAVPGGPPVAFDKYTVLGNNFLLVDEARSPMAGDAQRSDFARWALDGCAGVGAADNVVYLARRPGAPGEQYNFRIFEWDGAETLSCGNGLLCAAATLAEHAGGSQFPVWTELPTGLPRLVRVGVGHDGQAWVDMGWPRATPAALYRREGPVPPDGVDIVDGLRVELPAGREWTRGLTPAVELSGWLVFTGEPHLVVPLGAGLPDRFGDAVFAAPGPDGDGRPGSSRAERDSDALVDHLGGWLNARYRHRFPQGVHLNLVRVVDAGRAGPGLLEYRTWERAIDRETLACGTGALACAYLCRAVGLTASDRTTLWPHRARRHRPDATLRVTDTSAGLVLGGSPVRVCTGTARPEPRPAGRTGPPSHPAQS